MRFHNDMGWNTRVKAANIGKMKMTQVFGCKGKALLTTTKVSASIHKLQLASTSIKQEMGNCFTWRVFAHCGQVEQNYNLKPCQGK